MKYFLKNTTPIASKSFIISLFLGVSIAACGGISLAYFSYCETMVEREIDKTERRIEQNLLQIHTLQMRSDQILNLFAMRKTLQESGTSLIPIPAGVTEDVLPIKDTITESTASTKL